MSDFDDEPTEGLEATDEPAEAAEASADESAAAAEPAPVKKKPRPKPVPDDDWDDDWDDDEDGGGGGKRDLTLVYAIVIAAIVIVVAVVLTRPKDDSSTSGGNGDNTAQTTAPAAPVKNWQGAVGDAVGPDGKDAQKRAESAEGIYIWTDFGGWHLRNNGAEAASVTVTADQVKEAKAGEFATETTVTLPAGDGAEGADLDLGNSENATFTVTIGGADVPADQIFLGGAEGVADQNPVTFVKS